MSERHQIGEILVFCFLDHLLYRATMYWKLILKSPIFVLCGDNLTYYGAKSDHLAPKIAHKPSRCQALFWELCQLLRFSKRELVFLPFFSFNVLFSLLFSISLYYLATKPTVSLPAICYICVHYVNIIKNIEYYIIVKYLYI